MNFNVLNDLIFNNKIDTIIKDRNLFFLNK